MRSGLVLPQAILLAAFALGASAAWAGNRDSFLLGNEAALSGGAVTATVSDGGSLWYNPAGLGQNRRRRFNVNGSAFVLRFRDLYSAVRTNLDGVEAEETELRSVQFLSVPSASTITLQLRDGISLSAGSFAAVLDRYRVSNRLNGTVPTSGELADASFGRDGFENAILLGVGMGFQPKPWLRFGFSLFVVYEHTESSAHLSLSLVDPTNAPGAGAHQTFRRDTKLNRIGFDSAIGLQISPVAGLRIGLCFRPPRMHFVRFGTSTLLVTQSASVGDSSFSNFELTDDQGTEQDVLLTRMPTTVLAFAWEAERFRIGLEGDITPPLTHPGGGVLRRTLWNLRVGTKFSVSDKVSLGIGAFTDRSDLSDPIRFHEQRFDYYGGTFGLQMANPIVLAKGEKAKNIVLVSTLALRYAAGVGEAGTLRVTLHGFSDLSAETSRPEFGGTQSALFHEVSLHVGNAFLF